MGGYTSSGYSAPRGRFGYQDHRQHQPSSFYPVRTAVNSYPSDQSGEGRHQETVHVNNDHYISNRRTPIPNPPNIYPPAAPPVQPNMSASSYAQGSIYPQYSSSIPPNSGMMAPMQQPMNVPPPQSAMHTSYHTMAMQPPVPASPMSNPYVQGPSGYYDAYGGAYMTTSPQSTQIESLNNQFRGMAMQSGSMPQQWVVPSPATSSMVAVQNSVEMERRQMAAAGMMSQHGMNFHMQAIAPRDMMATGMIPLYAPPNAAYCAQPSYNPHMPQQHSGQQHVLQSYPRPGVMSQTKGRAAATQHYASNQSMEGSNASYSEVVEDKRNERPSVSRENVVAEGGVSNEYQG